MDGMSITTSSSYAEKIEAQPMPTIGSGVGEIVEASKALEESIAMLDEALGHVKVAGPIDEDHDRVMTGTPPMSPLAGELHDAAARLRAQASRVHRIRNDLNL